MLSMEDLTPLIFPLTKIENGFKHIVAAGDELLKSQALDHLAIARQLIIHPTYQGRMLGTHLLGALSAQNDAALDILKNEVAKDENWRVQEMLAKAFDQYVKTVGYEKSLPVIKKWLTDSNHKVVRAVIEGLRIWTSKPYFKENPLVAIQLIAVHKADESEYVRKSVGNALRDICRKHADLVSNETNAWDLTDLKIAFTYKLIVKNE